MYHFLALSKMKKTMETTPQHQPGNELELTPHKGQLYAPQRRRSSVLHRSNERRKSV